jgi:hypothetical protein
MASQHVQQNVLFYNTDKLAALNPEQHGTFGIVPRTTTPFAGATHAIPLTVDEFAVAQRHYPIIFSMGGDPVPLALVGLNEGKNLYVDADGAWAPSAYIPAFVRRYPFMLVPNQALPGQLTLCFDPTSDVISADGENKLFDGTAPTETTKGILAFCEQFENAVGNTKLFMEELVKLDLLMDGEVKIEQPNMPQPAVYKGFRMISVEKFRNIRGDKARQLVQSGVMDLIYAHMFSLSLIGGLFERQQQQQQQIN